LDAWVRDACDNGKERLTFMAPGADYLEKFRACLGNVVAGAFQIIFHVKMHVNDVFFIF